MSRTFRRHFPALLAAAVALCLPGGPGQAEPILRERIVAPGQKVMLFSWAHFDKNCVTTGFPKIVPVDQPLHGDLVITREPITITRSSFEKCIGCKT